MDGDGTYATPAGMAVLDVLTPQTWITGHLQPMEQQMDHLFQHVYPDLNHVSWCTNEMGLHLQDANKL